MYKLFTQFTNKAISRIKKIFHVNYFQFDIILFNHYVFKNKIYTSIPALVHKMEPVMVRQMN